MPWPVHPTGFFGARGDSDTYRIERSLRFNSADSPAPYLSRTPTASNRDLWTAAFWCKRGKLGAIGQILGVVNTNQNIENIGFTAGDALEWTITVSNVAAGQRTTTQLFRDPSAWYHFVVVYDSVNGTDLDRMKIYLNGVRITSFSTTTNPNSGQDSWVNSANAHYLGQQGDSTEFFDGYLTEIHFIDGQALTPSSFGETDAITGRWKAKAYSGTYGTNGFYLSFKDNTSTTTLGYDDAGSNDWTLNNFSVTAGADNDSLVDSPTNYGSDTGLGGEVRGNYCTWNTLDSSGNTIADGNLRVTEAGINYNQTLSAQAITYKTYAEFTISTLSGQIGVQTGSRNDVGSGGLSAMTIGYNTLTSGVYAAGEVTVAGSGSGTTYTAPSANDVFMISVDPATGKVWMGLQGTWFNSGNPSSGTGEVATISISDVLRFAFGRCAGVGGVVYANFGQRPFAYTAPTGFKALCTQNLPQPTIQKPSTAMDVVTYTGTGASQSISSLGFSPDLVWIKGRSGATDHALYDVIRGSQARLESNTTDAEVTSDDGLTSFDSAGFTVGTLAQVNTNTATYVGWSWDAGSTTSTNNSGSITSTVRANPQAGFSIVSYTGTGANSTVGHGLGVAPSMMIFKNRTNSGDSWDVYHKSNGNTKEIFLNSTAAATTSTTAWNSTSPTSSVFSIGARDDVNRLNGSFIAYCFSEIEGYSKFGSYTGNGSSDGPFVWCGFRPRWVMIKRSDSTSNWELFDTAREPNNVMIKELYPNLSDVENASSSDEFDIISNGFKPRSTNTIHNASGGTYIFAAFAEAPFKYARAR